MKNTEKPPVETGLVLYCDGGARPNPGCGGIGVHGYFYDKVASKKGIGLKGIKTTDLGYFETAMPAFINSEEDIVYSNDPRASSTLTPVEYTVVTPTKYVDIYKSLGHNVTNNLAEMSALICVLKTALESEGIQSVTAITDSRFVKDGTENWMHTWSENDWIKTNGGTVTNLEQWKEIHWLCSNLKDKGIELKLRWVRGHSGDTGNEKVDKLATLGVVRSKTNTPYEYKKLTDPTGYWKTEIEKHPFISNRAMYFNTNPEFVTKGTYYLGDHGIDANLGAKSADGAYCVVMLDKPEPTLEFIRDYHARLGFDLDNIISVKLDALFNASLYGDIQEFGELALTKKYLNRSDLFSFFKRGLTPDEPVTRELNPPYLAFRSVEFLSVLNGILTAFKSSDKMSFNEYSVTEITDVFYDIIEDKPGKAAVPKKQLKPTIGNSALDICVTGTYPICSGSQSIDINLRFGVDIPRRNNFKRAEELDPRVYLIIYSEAPDVLRYVTIIEAGKDIGIWAGVYSNAIYLQAYTGAK